MLNCSKSFSEWFDGTFLCSRQSSSPILVSENRTEKARFIRVREICEMILNNPKKSQESLREEIALKYFLTMRVALDYFHFSQLVIREYEKFK